MLNVAIFPVRLASSFRLKALLKPEIEDIVASPETNNVAVGESEIGKTIVLFVFGATLSGPFKVRFKALV